MQANIYDWANRHGLGQQAILELCQILDVPSTGIPEGRDGSEAAVQAEIMIAAARNGCALWRNNSGALRDENGRLVRYGLGNNSSRINDVWKSADLIGILPVMIEPQHVGTVIGRFWAVEVKEPGWRRIPSDKRATAQANFLSNVNALGGQGQFAQSVKDVMGCD